MLIKLSSDHYINSDYIIDLYLSRNERKDNQSKLTWSILGRMIDSALLVLLTCNSYEEAEIEYSRLINDANSHSTRIIK